MALHTFFLDFCSRCLGVENRVTISKDTTDNGKQILDATLEKIEQNYYVRSTCVDKDNFRA